MSEVLSDRCPRCGRTISYTPDATKLLCPCGYSFLVVEFVSERLKMEQAQADKAKAQQELAAAEAEKAALQNRLNNTLTALQAIEGSQAAEGMKLDSILDSMKADSQTHKAMTEFLRSIQQEQKSGQDALSQLMRALMKEQNGAADKLSTVQELSAHILAAQKSGAAAMEQMQNRILERIEEFGLKAMEKFRLSSDFITWSRSMQEADVQRLQALQSSSGTLLQGQKQLTEKVDSLSNTIAQIRNAVSKGFDELRKQRLDTLIELYHQATGLQLERNFDKAEEKYRELLAKGGQDAQDAEIYWRMLLCHYGVEYQEENGKTIPIILRPDLTDPSTMQVRKDLFAHIKNETQRAHYTERLEKIDFYLNRYRAVRLNPAWTFDVFISVKQSDQEHYTEDSDRAADLYNYFIQDPVLAAKKLRVFNSRYKKPPVGEEYEPYIISALMSAKVLIVVGSTPEYLNSQWVKNEWSRFQYLQDSERKQGKTDRRLFCYLTGGMKPEKLPLALNPDKQVLTEGPATGSLLREIMDKAFPDKVTQPPVPEPVEPEGKLMMLIKRGNMALEDGEWDKASEYFERALDLDAECAEAYEGRYLVERRAASLEKLIRKQLEDVKSPAREMRKAVGENQAHIQAIAEKNSLSPYLTRQTIEEEYNFDRSYPSVQAYYAAQYEKAKQAFAADKNLRRALRFAKGAYKARLEGLQSECLNTLEAHLTRARAEDEAAIARIRAAYEEHLARADAKVAELRRQAEAKQKEQRAADERKRQIWSQQAAAAKKRTNIVVAVIVGLILMMVVANQIESTPRIPLKMDSTTISAGGSHTVAVMADRGVVIAAGDHEDVYYAGKCSVFDWIDIVAVSAGMEHTVGLSEDGTVVAVGDKGEGQCAVFDWTDIMAVSAGGRHTVGLKSDGTVVAVGSNEEGQCNVSGWKDIVAISAGYDYTVGLKSDGTVVAVGNNAYDKCRVAGWKGIVAISAGDYHTVGLKSDGTVVAVGDHAFAKCEVSDWKDIVAISAGSEHTVGLKSDGTVVAVGNNDYGQCNVSGWKNIVAISAGDYHTVGLKSDGPVVAIGRNEDGQCDVSTWQGIKLPQ